MPCSPSRAGLRRAVKRQLADGWCGPPIVCGHRRIPSTADACWLRLIVEADSVVVICHAPRAVGAGAVLALADDVTALFRGCDASPIGFASPSIDVDGRDPDGFRAVVTLPIRDRDAR